MTSAESRVAADRYPPRAFFSWARSVSTSTKDGSQGGQLVNRMGWSLESGKRWEGRWAARRGSCFC